VVLQVEGNGEGFTATRVETAAVSEAERQPAPDAQAVTPDELTDRRSKALANFRQRLFSAPLPGN